MTTVNIKPTQIRAALIGERDRAVRALMPAALGAAKKLAKHMVGVTEAAEIPDGLYHDSWDYEATPTGAATFNDAPHAGVIELGARPHRVSAEGLAKIEEWVRKKMRFDFAGRDAKGRFVKGRKGMPKAERDAKVKAAAWGIAEKIRREGQKPHYLMRDAQPEARKFFAEEYARIMSRRRGRR